MEKVNVVILAEEVQYRVKVKNKIVNEDVAIVGYSDFKEESKLKIEGYFPDVIVCALDSSDIDEDFYSFIQSVQFQNRELLQPSLRTRTEQHLISLVQNKLPFR